MASASSVNVSTTNIAENNPPDTNKKLELGNEYTNNKVDSVNTAETLRTSNYCTKKSKKPEQGGKLRKTLRNNSGNKVLAEGTNSKNAVNGDVLDVFTEQNTSTTNKNEENEEILHVATKPVEIDASFLNNEVDDCVVFKTSYKNPVFLQEPFHSDGLELSQSEINNLNGSSWLTTILIDFLIKWGIPPNKTENLIVPSTGIGSLIDIYLRKSVSKSTDEINWYTKKQQQMQYFSERSFKFIMCNCTHNHFFVVSLEFNANDDTGNLFTNITIYDSMSRSKQKNDVKINKNFFHGHIS